MNHWVACSSTETARNIVHGHIKTILGQTECYSFADTFKLACEDQGRGESLIGTCDESNEEQCLWWTWEDGLKY